MAIWRLFPSWTHHFITNPRTALPDIHAGAVMALLAIPQSLGYATLAGLPPVMGLYSAIVPTLVYAWCGVSAVNAVGPVAITAMMTASALSIYANSPHYIYYAITLAIMVGTILLLASILRLGWIMQFVSRGVCQGFISGTAVLIVISQLKHIFGTPIHGDGIVAVIKHLMATGIAVHLATSILGLVALSVFLLNRYRAKLLWGFLPISYIETAKRFFTIASVIIAIVLAKQFHWQELGIHTLTALPTTLPTAAFPNVTFSLITTLLPSALLIGLVAFVSSSAIASNFARQRQESFSYNKELMALGFANIASGIFGGFAVAGGVSRTSLNVSVGANSPLASVVCALGILLIMVFLGSNIAGLPYAILSAIIISSVVSMVDIRTLKNAWQFDKGEAINFLTTCFSCILFGLNIGLITGLLISFAGVIYRSCRVHIAVLGQVGNSEHFRNVCRHKTTTFDALLLIRIDESMYFGNVSTIKDTLYQLQHTHSSATDIVIVMTGVHHIDLSAQEMLNEFNHFLCSHNKKLHFSEIKGPVMDAIKDTPMIHQLSGQVFLSTNLAVQQLTCRSSPT